MSLQASAFFQGQDWLTHRMSVAQVFETLDRMTELCHPLLPFDTDSDHVVFETFEVFDDLAEELRIQLDLVMADLHPYLQNSVPLRWASVELRMLATQLRAIAAVPDDMAGESDRLSDIAMHLVQIKQLVKKLDQ